MLGWRGLLKFVLGTSLAVLACLGAFVFATNPYGNLPASLLGEHVIMDSNQRFQFPAVIRSKRYDSLVIGTSTSRLLSPHLLQSRFGGTFANLAMDSGMAWEQYQLFDLFLREVPTPRTLLVGLDVVWCKSDADVVRTTPRGFPEWMFDDTTWNDLPYMLNGRTIEIGARRLGYALGLLAERIGPDGYNVFTPPESSYDPVKVRHELWGSEGQKAQLGQNYIAPQAERRAWRFPALAWLEDILLRWPGDVLLVFMPVHVTAQPPSGSLAAAREAECKARTKEIAARYHVHLVDFRIHSHLTSNDDNFWDPLHHRLPIADKIVAEIKQAIDNQSDDWAGDWRYLAGPGLQVGIELTSVRSRPAQTSR